MPLGEDLCVLSGKKINPLTLPTGRQAQRIAKFSTKVHKGLFIMLSLIYGKSCQGGFPFSAGNDRRRVTKPQGEPKQLQ